MARLARSLTTDLPWSGIRAFCRLAMRRADVRVEGLGHLPATGPAVIAARHFHHFYDGCALLAVVPRRCTWSSRSTGCRTRPGAR
jgi:1-acyl-sn-glycerol-3-phosphate acyltransferase